MNRILTALTAALFALTLTAVPDAQACISCSYTPEVIGTPSHSGPPKRSSKPVVRERVAPSPKRPAKIEREVRRERPERPAAARSKPRNDNPRKDVERQTEPSRDEPATKAAAPNESAGQNEQSAKAVVPDKQTEPAQPADASVADSAESNPAPPLAASASRALSEADAAQAARNDGPQPAKDCKKYIPGAGVTVTVRCE